jgi:hypothetical protein
MCIINTLDSKLTFTPIPERYIKDQFGFVYWPKDWEAKLMPRTKKDPWEYTVVEKPEKNMEDSTLDRFYEGSHRIYVENVPEKVKEVDLLAWIR